MGLGLDKHRAGWVGWDWMGRVFLSDRLIKLSRDLHRQGQMSSDQVSRGQITFRSSRHPGGQAKTRFNVLGWARLGLVHWVRLG